MRICVFVLGPRRRLARACALSRATQRAAALVSAPPATMVRGSAGAMVAGSALRWRPPAHPRARARGGGGAARRRARPCMVWFRRTFFFFFLVGGSESARARAGRARAHARPARPRAACCVLTTRPARLVLTGVRQGCQEQGLLQALPGQVPQAQGCVRARARVGGGSIFFFPASSRGCRPAHAAGAGRLPRRGAVSAGAWGGQVGESRALVAAQGACKAGGA